MTLNRWLIIIAIVLAAVVVSVESIWQPAELLQKINPKPLADEKIITLYAHKLKRWQFDDQGSLQLTVTSPKLLQYQGSERYWLKNPEALINQDKGVWQVRADNAYADKQYQQIKLLKNVRMQREQTLIVSENVVLDNQSAKAYTDAKVTLTQGGNTTRAKGFAVAFDEQSILLKKQVESYYAPNSRP